MPRPLLLAFLLLVLIITSQFEWKQPLVTDLENTLSIAQKQSRVSVRREAVKEKVVVSLVPVQYIAAESFPCI